MMKNTDKKIKIANCTNLSLIDFECNADLLLIGNFDGICGNETQANKTNIMTILKTIKNGHNVYVFGGINTINHIGNLINEWNKKIKIGDSKYLRNHFRPMNFDKYSIDEIIPEIKRKFKSMGKIKNMIVNPPYDGTLHLDFLNTCIDNLSGKMTIIEPARWIIDLNPNSTYNTGCKNNFTPKIRERLKGHIESVIIENFNKEFGIGLFLPFAITTIDMTKTFETIDCVIFGEHKVVESLYDCNLIGKYETINSIFKKVHKFNDVMCNHITEKNMGGNYWYTKYAYRICNVGCKTLVNGAGKNNQVMGNDSDSKYIKHACGYFQIGYLDSAYHHSNNDISNDLLYVSGSGGKITDKTAKCIYGTKQELENWKYFIFNNKLPLFLNIALTLEQNNGVMNFLPWIVDKQYTDDEINKLFGFTDDEIKLIDTTIKKYERNSPWFKRYIGGKESVSDDEVNTFIQEISK